MDGDAELSIHTFQLTARLRTWLFYGLFGAVAVSASDFVLSRGATPTVVLLLGFVIAGVVAAILWQPRAGLYVSVFLNLALEPSGATKDPITNYTSIFFEDLNTRFHAGAVNPLEILLILTTIAYLVRALDGHTTLRGGLLRTPVFILGAFMLGGYVWGLAHQGDWKTGLFEVRGPAMIPIMYFLVANLATEPRHVKRLLNSVIAGLAVLAIWGAARFFIFYHGRLTGPDDSYTTVHEDAVFLAFLAIIFVLRAVFGGSRKQTWLLLALTPPGLFAMFEMQRRAAFVSLFMALAVIAIALYAHRRRAFWTVIPPAALLMLVYTAAFWNSSSILAQPIRAWRTQTSSTYIDPRDQSSNLYRITEKADIRATIRSAPLTGVGFGKPFFNLYPIWIDPNWPFQFYTPHAEVLWIWLKVGAFGFTAFWYLICTALAQAGNVIRRVGMPNGGFTCLLAACFIVMLLTFSYVDVGLANERCELLLGTMLGIIGVTARRAMDKPTPAAGSASGGRPAAPAPVAARALAGSAGR